MKFIKFKKLKFKNNSLTIDRYLKIVFKDTKKNIYTVRRKYFKGKKINCDSYYRGDIKKGKANGWGAEIIHTPFVLTYGIDEYYEGDWKDGKRNGYGEEYNYYPPVGFIDDPNLDALVVKSLRKVQIADYAYENAVIYRGNWSQGKKNGEGERYIFGAIPFSPSIKETGIFKNDKLWKGKKIKLNLKTIKELQSKLIINGNL